MLTPEMERYWHDVDQRRPAPKGKRRGTLISTSIDSDRVIEQEQVQCVHCGRHWTCRKDSGRKRGLCLRCNGVTCGPGCPMGESCIPQEKAMEMVESGIPWNRIKDVADRMPVSVSVEVSAGGILLGKA